MKFAVRQDAPVDLRISIPVILTGGKITPASICPLGPQRYRLRSGGPSSHRGFAPGFLGDSQTRGIDGFCRDGQEPPPGTLPTVSNSRDWLRQAQRFPVVVGFTTDDPELRRQLRIGGQASVLVLTEEATLTRWLGRFYIRLMSWLSYAY